jgi:hypothetical protein
MISALYIALTTKRLELELNVIRHFLLHPDNRAARDSVVATETKEYAEACKRYQRRQPQRSEVDEMLVGWLVRGREPSLKTNLNHIVEFSENRLNQMELLLRYCLFEGFLSKTVGNILWEYPELAKHDIHDQLARRQSHKKCQDYHRRRLRHHPEGERIAWTIATVEAVDHLPFDQWKEKVKSSSTIYLWEYLSAAFGLAIQQRDLWPALERLRRIRNHVVHHSLELPISGDRMKDARICLGNFPALLVRTAAKSFPKACTEEPPGEGDQGTPAYVLLESLDQYF